MEGWIYAVCTMYVQCTVYRIQTEYMFTFAIGSAGRISTVLGIPSYPHPHPLRETNHRWVCVAKLCFCFQYILLLLCTCMKYVLERIWTISPEKPCDCSSTPEYNHTRHLTLPRIAMLMSNKHWHPRQKWGTRPSSGKDCGIICICWACTPLHSYDAIFHSKKDQRKKCMYVVFPLIATISRTLTETT